MDLIADGLLILAALVASLYCWVLSRRLRRLTQLDKGLGAAISSLSEQVEEMQTALAQSKESIEARTTLLANLTKEADQAIRRLDGSIKAASEVTVPTAPSAGLPVSEPVVEPIVYGPGFDETILELNDEDPDLVAPLEDELEDQAILRVDRADEELEVEMPQPAETPKLDEPADDAIASLVSLTKDSNESSAGALDRLLKALKRDPQEQPS